MIRRLAGLAVAGLLLAGCIGKTTDSPAPIDIKSPGQWTAHAPMPTARQEVAVAELNGRIFVIGGLGDSAEPVATVEVYDPATDRWESRAPLPAATHHAAAAVVGGRLYVAGGYTGGRVSWTVQRTVYEYDDARSSWATRAPLRMARGGLAMVALGGRLHVVGGSSEGATNAHEVYDPATDAWSTGTPLPVGRGGLAAAVLGDAVFVFGGEAPLRIFSATEMYEVAGNRWIGKDPMRTPRHGIGAVAVGGKIYLPGGATEPGFARTDVNEAYSP